MSELTRISCVEDDDDIRAIIELALVDVGGFSVKLFENGFRAVEQIDGAWTQLIMLDVMMPGMDGLETLQKLRDLPGLAHTPAIFMTAKAQPNELGRYREAGAVDVIIKPFDPMTLADRLREIWEKIHHMVAD